MKLLRRLLRGEQGFTLVELMVVVIILGVLAAIAVPQFMNRTETARDNAALSSLQSMKSVIDIWAAENGKYPLADVTTTSGIGKVLQDSGINWKYNNAGGIVDPWGQAFSYATSGSGPSATYTLYCADNATATKYFVATNTANPYKAYPSGKGTPTFTLPANPIPSN